MGGGEGVNPPQNARHGGVLLLRLVVSRGGDRRFPVLLRSLTSPSRNSSGSILPADYLMNAGTSTKTLRSWSATLSTLGWAEDQARPEATIGSGGREGSAASRWSPGENGTLFLHRFPLPSSRPPGFSSSTRAQVPTPPNRTTIWPSGTNCSIGLRDARYSLSLIAMQHDSPLPRRFDPAHRRLPRRIGRDGQVSIRLRREIALVAERIDEEIPFSVPDDIEGTIRGIEIETGLRADAPTPTAGWQSRRRSKRRGGPRR